MALKSRSLDELCYPYIYESSSLCDFEITTDELCSAVGWILSLLDHTAPDLERDLEQLQPLIFHLNGSIRGEMALSESDLAWLHERYRHYRAETADLVRGFILPRGSQPVPQLHLCRSITKRCIRIMVRLDREGIEIPERLTAFCNLLCNLFFVLTRVINRRRGFPETRFQSKSYACAD